MGLRHESHDNAKKNYDAVMNGTEGENIKGVHMGNRPYLWREVNPVHPELDTPCENFVPTPTISSSDDVTAGVFSFKKAVKIGLTVLLIGFMIYAMVASIVENPNLFKFGGSMGDQYF